MSTTLASPTPRKLSQRPRRNRQSAALRSLSQECEVTPKEIVVPLFLLEGEKRVEAIPSMPGIHRYSLDQVLFEVERLHKKGVVAIDLFTLVPSHRKDLTGSEASREGNLLSQSISQIKTHFPEICVMADVALDPFTSHGHDGVTDERGEVCNDATLDRLVSMALLAAQSGADVIAPSDMMDGRVGAIRQALDEADCSQVGILSYTAKYASAFYGPFRDAMESAPQFGDKKSYQMNPANKREALREAQLDLQEGADMLLVKPALPYLDVLSTIKESCHIPVGGYHVSGEYAMAMAAHEKGWLDGPQVLFESLLSIKRAGADFIFSYAVDALPS